MICAIALFAVASCGGDPAPRAYTSQIDARTLPVLNVTIDTGAGTRDGTIIEAGGEALRKIGLDMAQGRPPASGPIETINLLILGTPHSDDSKANKKILHLSIAAPVLSEKARAGASADDIMAAAHEVGWWTPANDDVVNRYCARHSAGEFCRIHVPV